MTGWAADFSAFQIDAAGLKAAGYSAAVRYIVGAGKQISQGEFNNLTQTPGMALALVNETFGQAASRGYNQGKLEAQAAFSRADLLGWPHDRPIYFVGEDPTHVPAPIPLIEDYFRAVLTVVPVSRVGFYGSAVNAQHMKAIGLATYGWAVETWPGSPVGLHLRQMYNPVPGAPTNFGGQVDPNMVMLPEFGQWSATTPPPAPVVQPAPVPIEQPEAPDMISTDQLVPGQIDTFHVDEHGRLIHHWFAKAANAWAAQVLADGCAPVSPVCITVKSAVDGMSHVFAEKPGGGQAHRYWDGKAWHADDQPPV